MRFRSGLMVGFGVGYYYGAKAGRERFDKIDGVLRRLGAAESIDLASGKARAALDLGMERARDLVGSPHDDPAPARSRRRGAVELQPPADPSLN